MKILYLYLLLPAIFFRQLSMISAKGNLTDDPKTEFSAKVDGKEWTGGIVGCNVEISSMEFFAMGIDNTGLKILLNAPAGEGTFEISKKSKHKVSYGPAGTSYTIGKDDVGKVIVSRYDAAKKLFSGTFEFTLTNEKTGKKVKITNGVFSNLAFYDKPATKFEFKAKLNGAKWNWIASASSVSRDTANIIVSGSGEKYLSIKFPGNTPPGEYIIAAQGDIFAYYKSYKIKDDVGLKPKSGKLIILENDPKKKIVSGKFEIEMIDEAGNVKARFTDGIFTMFHQE